MVVHLILLYDFFFVKPDYMFSYLLRLRCLVAYDYRSGCRRNAVFYYITGYLL